MPPYRNNVIAALRKVLADMGNVVDITPRIKEKKANDAKPKKVIQYRIGYEHEPLKDATPSQLRKFDVFKKNRQNRLIPHRINIKYDDDSYSEFWYRPETDKYSWSPPLGYVSGDDKWLVEIVKNVKKEFKENQPFFKKIWKSHSVPELDKILKNKIRKHL